MASAPVCVCGWSGNECRGPEVTLQVCVFQGVCGGMLARRGPRERKRRQICLIFMKCYNIIFLSHSPCLSYHYFKLKMEQNL